MPLGIEEIEECYLESEIPTTTGGATSHAIVRTSDSKIRALPKDDIPVNPHDHEGDILKLDGITSTRSDFYITADVAGDITIRDSDGYPRIVLRSSDSKIIFMNSTVSSGAIITNNNNHVSINGSHNDYGVFSLILGNTTTNGRALAYSWELHSSSIMNKTNIEPLPSQTDALSKIRALEYDYAGERKAGIVVEDLDASGIKGIISKSNGEIVSWNSVPLVVALLKEVQDLRKEMEALKK